MILTLKARSVYQKDADVILRMVQILAGPRFVPPDRCRHHRQRLEWPARTRRSRHRFIKSQMAASDLAGACQMRRRQLLQLKNPDRMEDTS